MGAVRFANNPQDVRGRPEEESNGMTLRGLADYIGENRGCTLCFYGRTLQMCPGV